MQEEKDGLAGMGVLGFDQDVFIEKVTLSQGSRISERGAVQGQGAAGAKALRRGDARALLD